MYSSRKVPTEIETELSSSACAGLGETILVPAENTEVKREPSSPACSHEICVSTQLVEPHYSVEGDVRTKRKYHTHHDCRALKHNYALCISLCKLVTLGSSTEDFSSVP